MTCSVGELDDKVFDVFSVYEPVELVYANLEARLPAVRQFIKSRLGRCALTPYEVDAAVDYEGLGKTYFPADAMKTASPAALAVGILLTYVKDVMKSDVSHISSLRPLAHERCLLIDASGLRHLEITQNVRDGRRKGTLLEVLDYTETAMGPVCCASGWKRPCCALPISVRGRMRLKTCSVMKL